MKRRTSMTLETRNSSARADSSRRKPRSNVNSVGSALSAGSLVQVIEENPIRWTTPAGSACRDSARRRVGLGLGDKEYLPYVEACRIKFGVANGFVMAHDMREPGMSAHSGGLGSADDCNEASASRESMGYLR